MNKISATEFKAKCLGLLDEVSKRGVSYAIMKHGKVVARIIPALDETHRYPQLGLRDSVEIVGDALAPVTNADDWEVQQR